jgi:hypothetical protein
MFETETSEEATYRPSHKIALQQTCCSAAEATFLVHARLSTPQIYTPVSVGRMMQTYRTGTLRLGTEPSD